jgi:hypothetical protein
MLNLAMSCEIPAEYLYHRIAYVFVLVAASNRVLVAGITMLVD